MVNFTEGWINKIVDGKHKYVVTVPEEGKEPIIKYFDNKVLYLPNEQERFEKEALKRGDNVLWLGITGWTKPPKHYPALYGTNAEPGIYDSLITALLSECVLILKQEGIDVDLRHGVSDAGVDAAAMGVMEKLKISGSGVNCPLYMPWVVDDTRGGSALVAENKESYHRLYSKYHQILLVTGGRDAAFYHDYLSRLKGEGYSIVTDVMQVVSREIIKSLDQMPGQDKPSLNNAAAYIREKNSFSYFPVPRTFDELMAVTKLSLLDNSYNLLKKQPNVSLMSSLEQNLARFREESRKGNREIITKAELEDRISRTEKDFLALV